MAAYGMSRRFVAVKKLDAVERKADIPQPSPTGPSGENDPKRTSSEFSPRTLLASAGEVIESIITPRAC
jgi:hypothetical protein